MPFGATQDRWVMVERSHRMWSTGEGNGKPLQYSCLENPMNRMKRQNDRILTEQLPRSVGAQYTTGDQWRNNSRKNEGMEPKRKNNIHSCRLLFDTPNMPWFMNPTFQVPMQYCSLQLWTWLLSPVTSTTGCCFFSLAPSLHSFWSYFSTDLQ